MPGMTKAEFQNCQNCGSAYWVHGDISFVMASKLFAVLIFGILTGMADPKLQFSYIVEQLRKHKLTYIPVVKPQTSEHNSYFLQDIWNGREGSMFISINGHNCKVLLRR
ncbi:uncharacterized protein EDB91DRAFT_1086810 [Suillus paluster]|uniref:uncharacterized protein n=1 Tax=Suillus paluster TaxID=48578 RepID=UPI001B87CF9D|nr:uncharacterized protein EDB91DRAFT_1086810 [Suillus paluster]KAG1726360.1 hypothetical protein EDB91DRAFT_1086810 [Suillus paluster]